MQAIRRTIIFKSISYVKERWELQTLLLQILKKIHRKNFSIKIV